MLSCYHFVRRKGVTYCDQSVSMSVHSNVSKTAFDIDTPNDESDRKLFQQATQPGHSLHHLLPPKTSPYRPYQLRKRQHLYLLSAVQYSQFKNCYINRCLCKYV